MNFFWMPLTLHLNSIGLASISAEFWCVLNFFLLIKNKNRKKLKCSLRSKHASSHHVAFYWYVLGRNSFPRRLRSLSVKNSRNFPHLGKLSCGKKGFGKFRDSLFSCNVLKVSQENILKNVFHNQRIKVFTLKELNIFRPIWNFLLFWASTLIIRFHGFSYENFLKLFRNCQLKH